MTSEETAAAAMECIEQLRKLLSSKKNGAAPSRALPSSSLAVDTLFLQLRALYRQTATQSLRFRQQTTQAKEQTDQIHLRLQNLLYERNHLQRELEQCRDFQTIFDRLPLRAEHEFLQEAAEEVQAWQTQDPHRFMLARLQSELDERKRLVQEFQAEEAARKQLVEDLKKQKEKLDKMENQFDVLVKVSRTLQELTGHVAPSTNSDMVSSSSSSPLRNSITLTASSVVATTITTTATTSTAATTLKTTTTLVGKGRHRSTRDDEQEEDEQGSVVEITASQDPDPSSVDGEPMELEDGEAEMSQDEPEHEQEEEQEEDQEITSGPVTPLRGITRTASTSPSALLRSAADAMDHLME